MDIIPSQIKTFRRIVKNRLFMVLVLVLTGIVGILAARSRLRRQQIQQVAHSITWHGDTGGLIKSTDPAGIAYHAPSGHLFLADSEINETSQWRGVNVFEVSLDLTEIFNAHDAGPEPREPTGITYNTFDGYFYVTNDDACAIRRYNNEFGQPLRSVTTSHDVPDAKDPEGITSDPTTGFLYIADGKGGGKQVLIYDADLKYRGHFYVGDHLDDPEAIAYDPTSRHLFVLSSVDIAEYTLDGTLVRSFTIRGFYPKPIAPQGLTFAPTSDPDDDPSVLSLYIADGMKDNHPDGRVYEAMIKK